MKHLPDKFQMRVSAMPGFTNTVKRNAYGDYEVNWARGYLEALGKIPVKVFLAEELERFVGEGCWFVVEDKPKQEETKLPDEFVTTNVFMGNQWLMRKEEGVWSAYSLGNAKKLSAIKYTKGDIRKYVEGGVWKIGQKPTLTAEQQRTLKEYKEQVQQLDSSIRIQEQNAEHCLRMVANYESRQKDLLDKIKELEGA